MIIVKGAYCVFPDILGVSLKSSLNYYSPKEEAASLKNKLDPPPEPAEENIKLSTQALT